MKEKEWRKTIRKGCKLKKTSQDSSAYCVYCRKNGGSCNHLNCPLIAR